MSAGSNIIADFLEWMFFEKDLEIGTYEWADTGSGSLMEFIPLVTPVEDMIAEYTEFVNKRAEAQ